MPEQTVLELVHEIKSDHELFKKDHTALLKAKADGKSVGEMEAKIAAINEALDKKTQRLDQIEAAIKRSAVGGSEHKAGDAGDKVLRKAFRQWMSKGDKNGGGKSHLADVISGVFEAQPELRAAYLEEHPEVKALAIQDDTAGGYMVHADLTGRIVKRIFETSPIRSYANVTTISTDALEGGIDADQGTATWVGEEDTRTQTGTPKLGKWRIPVHELYAMPAATQQVLDDSAIDLESWLAMKVADKFRRAQNAAFVNGTGAGQPKGFTVEATISDANGASATYDTYITDRKIGYIPTGVAQGFPVVPTSGAPTAQANPLIDLMTALKTEYRESPGTAFVMHRTMYGAVRKLQDAFGQYIWQPGFAGQPATLFGYPIGEFNDLPAFSSSALTAQPYGIYFGNWKDAYQIVDRIGMRVLRDPFTAKGFVLFYTTMRCGGQVLNYEAIKALKFATS